MNEKTNTLRSIAFFVSGLLLGIIIMIVIGGKEKAPEITPLTFNGLDFASATLTFRESPVPVVTLNNGVYENDEARVSIGLIPEKFVYSDLNGDGIDDGVAAVYLSTGGSGVFVNIVAFYSGTTKGFSQTEPVFIGDRIIVEDIAIDDSDVINVTIKDRTPEQTMADEPSLTKIYKFKLQGGALVRI